MIPITVAIPVGPKEHHRKWLLEAMDSIESQMLPSDELLLIIEPPHVFDVNIFDSIDYKVLDSIKIVEIPILLGVAAMVNLSVGHASHEHVLLMNSDDKLLPGALEAVRNAWENRKDPRGWYYLNTIYSDGNAQKAASGVAMVCKSYFISIGGYPPETAVGFPDWMFLSLMQHRKLINPYPVSDEYLHWHRVHDDQETKKREAWRAVGALVHETLLKTWTSPGATK